MLTPWNHFISNLTGKTPRHGDRPFEIGHIDHTELDVEVVAHALVTFWVGLG